MLPNLSARSPARPLVQEVIRAADRAAALTRQLLIFSRQQVIQPKVLDLNGVVGDLQRFLRRIIGEDVELVTEVEEGLGSVEIDRTQIDQVLMNLVVNARDAMPEGGRVIIRTANAELDGVSADRQLGAPPGSYVVLSVSDTGRGMDRETMVRIFEPFFTTKERGKGTGLGLSTVFGIIQQSNGDIAVHSEPGVGTTIRVYLPKVNAEPSNSRLRVVKNGVPGGSETILLVEDEETVRGLAEELLRSAGYSVIAAAGGDEALSLASNHSGRIDLLLTDMVMPGMSGLQVAERLTAHHPKAKVMFMSGFPGDIAVRDRERLGSAPFLSKPFNKLTLTRQVREVLDAPAS
jgi:two-component system, cell cycle sensor histidine kinase and response regulator CckA